MRILLFLLLNTIVNNAYCAETNEVVVMQIGMMKIQRTTKCVGLRIVTDSEKQIKTIKDNKNLKNIGDAYCATMSCKSCTPVDVVLEKQ